MTLLNHFVTQSLVSVFFYITVFCVIKSAGDTAFVKSTTLLSKIFFQVGDAYSAGFLLI